MIFKVGDRGAFQIENPLPGIITLLLKPFTPLDY
jgi:hypothetical protein